MGETIVKNSNQKGIRGNSSKHGVRSKKKKETRMRTNRALSYPSPIMKLLHSRRKPNRLLEVYSLLEHNAGWLSAEDINLEMHYVKRTLQGILNKLVERKAVKKTRSLSDARVTLFSAIPIENILMCL